MNTLRKTPLLVSAVSTVAREPPELWVRSPGPDGDEGITATRQREGERQPPAGRALSGGGARSRRAGTLTPRGRRRCSRELCSLLSVLVTGSSCACFSEGGLRVTETRSSAVPRSHFSFGITLCKGFAATVLAEDVWSAAGSSCCKPRPWSAGQAGADKAQVRPWHKHREKPAEKHLHYTPTRTHIHRDYMQVADVECVVLINSVRPLSMLVPETQGLSKHSWLSNKQICKLSRTISRVTLYPQGKI